MILQSLMHYYDVVSERGEIAPAGWCDAKVPLAMDIEEDGTLKGFESLMYVPENSKRERPPVLKVPQQVKRTSGSVSNFLCDNAQYFLGIVTKEGRDPERQKQLALQCFRAAGELHHAVLGHVQSEPAQAVLRYFEHWDPEKAEENPHVAEPSVMDRLMKGGNLVLRYHGRFVYEDPDIRRAWEAYRRNADRDVPRARCLVTGKTAPVAIVHPPIKNVMGAQSFGAALVCFNAPSCCSYGHEQGMNAPVSLEAAFKYGTALNFLTARPENVLHVADMTVVFWSETANHAAEELFGASLGAQNNLSELDLHAILERAANGQSVQFKEQDIDPADDFCVLGLAPNAGRIFVRFFQRNTFGSMIRNLEQHIERLRISGVPQAESGSMGIWAMLNETANQSARTKMPPPPTANAVLSAILTGQPYPYSLLQNIMIRIRAERALTWRKAAMIKAWILKCQPGMAKEAATVELNEASNYIPYVLGREFAVLERIQIASVGKTRGSGNKAAEKSGEKEDVKQSTPQKSIMRERYFTSAATTPAVVFPVLMRLSQHHQAKLSDASKVWSDKLLTDLQSRIHEPLPAHLTLQEQGAFYLGYYHQKQAMYAKKSALTEQAPETKEKQEETSNE